MDAFGWIMSIIMLAGGYGVAHKKVLGLVAFLIGNIGWAIIGFETGLWSLFGLSLAFSVMDLYAIEKWRKR